MVLNDYKTKAVLTLISNFNAENENEKDGGRITINSMYYRNVNAIEFDNGIIYLKSYTDNRIFINGVISVNDINSMYYVDDMSNIVSIENIEF